MRLANQAGILIISGFLITVSTAADAPGSSSDASNNFQTSGPMDTDGDGVLDADDNCTLASNADQFDSNGDGYGNACDPDINNDCITAFLDFFPYTVAFGSAFGDPSFSADLDADNNQVINFLDLFLYSSLFLQPPGPSNNDFCSG